MTSPLVPASDVNIALAADLLRGGRLVAFPTETVYGLGADAGNAQAVRRIFEAKGRPADHPVIVHVAGAHALSEWVRDVPDGALRLAQACWPGPLTIVLPRAAGVSDALTGGQDTIGIRVPSHPVAQALLAAFAQRGGRGIAAPSANRFGHVSPTTAVHVVDDLGPHLAMVLDGGACPVGIESTIVAFRDGEPMLLRPGAIGVEALARALGQVPRSADAGAPRASGTLPSHYAPRTSSRLVQPGSLGAEVRQHLERDERCAVLARTRPRPDEFDGSWIAAPKDVEGYARALYASLRALDGADADVILIEAPPDDPEWLAVRDRLGRATRGEEPDEP